jgi:hypothetical protein
LTDSDDDNGDVHVPKPNGNRDTNQDERTLRRLIHQYPSWQVISTKVLPLYNSTKKPAALKHRYQQLRHNAKRLDKALFDGWKVGQVKPKAPVVEPVKGTRTSSRRTPSEQNHIDHSISRLQILPVL